MAQVMSEEDRIGCEADRIVNDSFKLHLNAQEAFKSIPRTALKVLIGLLEQLREFGPLGKNTCQACGHHHGNANWKFNHRMLMLDRAKQTLAGIWKTRKE